MSFDISNCTSLTDQSCTSIARHCTALEVLGMRNLKGLDGHGLSDFFLDEKKASNFRSIALSGTKNVNGKKKDTQECASPPNSPQ